jgi:hypothetical protein
MYLIIFSIVFEGLVRSIAGNRQARNAWKFGHVLRWLLLSI